MAETASEVMVRETVAGKVTVDVAEPVAGLELSGTVVVIVDDDPPGWDGVTTVVTTRVLWAAVDCLQGFSFVLDSRSL